jgi:predicted nuclease of predicted toxin-antitoxin system
VTLKILIDMNLSPDWVPVLEQNGWPTVHCSTVGDARATDHTILNWALEHGYVVLTHDLDFGTILALTHRTGPSVLQVRAQDVLPGHLAGLVTTALRQHESDLASGALLVVDEAKRRVRILPI